MVKDDIENKKIKRSLNGFLYNDKYFVVVFPWDSLYCVIDFDDDHIELQDKTTSQIKELIHPLYSEVRSSAFCLDSRLMDSWYYFLSSFRSNGYTVTCLMKWNSIVTVL